MTDMDGLETMNLVRAALGPIITPKPVDIFVHGTRLLAAKHGTYKIALAGAVTTDLIARACAVGAALEGLAPVTYQAPFGAWQQEALDAGSGLHKFAPHLVVVATTWRDWVADIALSTPAEDVAKILDAKMAACRSFWDGLRKTAPDRRIIHHLPTLPTSRFSAIAELRAPASPLAQIHALRTKMLEAGPDIIFLDTEGLAEDASAWFAAKLPFSQKDIPEYCVRFRAALRQATGRSKKLLAVDLDNTLWGGVIGDDGVDGLQLGPDTPKGEAFRAFQTYIRALAARGVVLAVCSKNAPEIAAAGFTHPHAVLKRSDFAAFECAWTDKAGGLRRIASQLNLGIDSFVFVDDNPAECALVRAELPEITVIELGEDPAAFIAKLDEGYWFASQGLSPEDLARGQAYQARAEAAAAQGDATDLPSFLASLDMKGKIFRAEGAALARIAQLEGKTNQFNLTTRRYNDAAIQAFAARPDAIVLGATLADKFGDHGLVASLIGVIDGDSLVIESWLMSCRVFSRTLEQFMLRALIVEAKALGLSSIAGVYEPTTKNGVVADLYPRLGFVEIVHAKTWRRAVEQPVDDLIDLIAIEAV